LYLGLTAMLRNDYNCFADPVFALFILIVIGFLIPVKFVLNTFAGYMKLWEISMEDNMRVDIGAINRLDKENNAVRMIRNI